MPPALVRVKRHDPYIAAIDEHVRNVAKMIDEMVVRLLSGGGEQDELLSALQASVKR